MDTKELKIEKINIVPRSKKLKGTWAIDSPCIPTIEEQCGLCDSYGHNTEAHKYLIDAIYFG